MTTGWLPLTAHILPTRLYWFCLRVGVLPRVFWHLGRTAVGSIQTVLKGRSSRLQAHRDPGSGCSLPASDCIGSERREYLWYNFIIYY